MEEEGWGGVDGRGQERAGCEKRMRDGAGKEGVGVGGGIKIRRWIHT